MPTLFVSKCAPIYADVPDEKWNDWRWQLSHRLNTVEEIEKVIPLTDSERKALWTPVLLRLSGLANPHIGRNLHLHPVSAMGAYFPERVEPWGGAMQTRYCAQFADMDGQGYGARFETGPIHFALPASAFGWANPRQLRDDVGRLAHMGHVGILLRDREAGRGVPNRWGHPRVLYDVPKHDAANMRRALEASARIMAAAGAEELFTLRTPPSRCRPGGTGWLERFMAQADATGYRRLRMSYVSFHQMGTAAVMLANCAQWARIPIHALCSKPCDPLPLELSVWWACYGYHCAVRQFAFLQRHRVSALGRDKVIRHRTYLFTVDWVKDGWAEIPDQHKNHHVIVLDGGQWIAYPNNRLDCG